MKYLVKQVYGNSLVYPACDVSRAYLKALGLKTFTPAAIEAAKVCGVVFEQVSAAVAI